MKLFWRSHNSDDSYRLVWREDWYGDQFEIVAIDDFETLETLAKPFGIHFEEAKDQD